MTVVRKVTKCFQGLKRLPAAQTSLRFLPLSFSLICGSVHDKQGASVRKQSGGLLEVSKSPQPQGLAKNELQLQPIQQWWSGEQISTSKETSSFPEIYKPLFPFICPLREGHRSPWDVSPLSYAHFLCVAFIVAVSERRVFTWFLSKYLPKPGKIVTQKSGIHPASWARETAFSNTSSKHLLCDIYFLTPLFKCCIQEKHAQLVSPQLTEFSQALV